LLSLVTDSAIKRIIKTPHNLYYQKRVQQDLAGIFMYFGEKPRKPLRIAYKRDDSYSLRVAQIARSV